MQRWVGVENILNGDEQECMAFRRELEEVGTLQRLNPLVRSSP